MKGDIFEGDPFLDRGRYPPAAAQIGFVALIEEAPNFLNRRRQGVERHPVEIQLFDAGLKAIEQDKKS